MSRILLKVIDGLAQSSNPANPTHPRSIVPSTASSSPSDDATQESPRVVLLRRVLAAHMSMNWQMRVSKTHKDTGEPIEMEGTLIIGKTEYTRIFPYTDRDMIKLELAQIALRDETW